VDNVIEAIDDKETTMTAGTAEAPLSVLEVIDAAGPDGLAPGRVEATGVWLYAKNLLSTGDELRVGRPNGKHADSEQLVEGLFAAVGAGLVRRSGGQYVLTPRGHDVLERAGVMSRDEARAAAAELASRDVDAVRAEADDLLS
jgi:hypothetical protein